MYIEIIDHFTWLEMVNADQAYKVYKSKVKAQYMCQCKDGAKVVTVKKNAFILFCSFSFQKLYGFMFQKFKRITNQ